MDAIDADPRVLQQTADAAAHAYEQSIVHVGAEIEGVIPRLMETLTPTGPYGYTIMPQVRPDGSVHLPIITTRQGIQEAYELVRGASALLSVSPLTEIRGTWYTFQDNVSRGRRRATGEEGASQTLALFPSGSGEGITGELVWVRVPRAVLGGGAPSADADGEEMFLREQVFEQHERYLAALRGGDVEGVLATLHDKVSSALRDYAHDTGTLYSIEGTEAHRAAYEALFDKYEIRSVEPLYRVAEEWYVFAEVRMTAVERADGTEVAFHTAEFHVPANDGRFVARIGHGTDPCPSVIP